LFSGGIILRQEGQTDVWGIGYPWTFYSYFTGHRQTLNYPIVLLPTSYESSHE